VGSRVCVGMVVMKPLPGGPPDVTVVVLQRARARSVAQGEDDARLLLCCVVCWGCCLVLKRWIEPSNGTQCFEKQGSMRVRT
jgi:hypothetical protein